MEFKVCWVCESIFALSTNVERDIAHWRVLPGIHIFEEVFKFTHVEQPVRIHIGLVEHLHERFFFVLVMRIVTVIAARSTGCSSPHESCSFTI